MIWTFPHDPKTEAVERYLDGTLTLQERENQTGEELAEAVKSSKEKLEQGDNVPEELEKLGSSTGENQIK